MTRYTVVWTREALDQLAVVWLDSSDRVGIASSAEEIDRTLADDPSRQGFEVREGLRGLVLPPLFAMFSVSEADRCVEILRVRLD